MDSLQELQGMSKEAMVAHLRKPTVDSIVLALFAYLPANAQIPSSNARLHRAFLALIPDATSHFPQLTEMYFHQGMSFPYSPLLHRIRIRLDIFLTQKPGSKDLQLNRTMRSVILRESKERFSKEECRELKKLAQNLADEWRRGK